MDKHNQSHAQRKLFETEMPVTKDSGPVTCLGMTFENDDKRREYFLEKLREKLKDPEFRKIEGFPIGEDVDILALSDPPYYTACPNPFIEDFIAHYGKPYDPSVPYSREPFAADVSEGKNDPIYNAHSYHTKVPHKAIMRYILHYTEPGDVVFDGFCGTGMAGVAAHFCGDRNSVESLGLKIKQDDFVLDRDWAPFSKLGKRNTIISDLSPLATFISYNLNFPLPRWELSKIYADFLKSLPELQEQLYTSFDDDGTRQGLINYVIWSDVYVCAECSEEYTYWNAAVDLEKGVAEKIFDCPHCRVRQSTRNLDRAYATDIDPLLNTPVRLFKQVPVRVSYIPSGNRKLQRHWNQHDAGFLANLGNAAINKELFPIIPLIKGDRWRRDAFEDKGVTHIHHFYTNRTIQALATIWQGITEEELDYKARIALSFLFTSFADRNATKRNRFIINKHNPRGRVNGPMANSLYLPNLFCEMNILRLMDDKYKDISNACYLSDQAKDNSVISTGSSSALAGIPSNSVDYIFTDPPFGHNIQYSELNLALESFLRVRTAGEADTVVNDAVGKPMSTYTDMMLNIFREYYRILKPGRWMTVEFHNSKSAVWSAIQEALGKAGFVIAHVATLDSHSAPLGGGLRTF